VETLMRRDPDALFHRSRVRFASVLVSALHRAHPLRSILPAPPAGHSSLHIAMNHLLRPLLVAVAAVGLAANAHAVADSRGDFLSSFTGTHDAALDILSADVAFDPADNEFLLRATTAGPIAGVKGAAYVFGFDTGGKANAPFASMSFLALAGVPGPFTTRSLC